MDGTSSTVTTTIPSLSFNAPSPTLFGAPISGVLSYSWPFNSASSGSESKITINVNGGYSASWSSMNSLTFTDTTLGSYLLLWSNTKLNKFVFQIPNYSSGSVSMTINNLLNPYPYQYGAYTTTNTI
jgi:hypothetical protein